MTQDDARQIRTRLAAVEDAARFGPGVDTQGGFVVGRTTTIASYPTAARAYYAVAVCAVTGAEAEGAAVTVTPGPRVVLAANLGPSVPPVGTDVRVFRLPGRYAFIYRG